MMFTRFITVKALAYAVCLLILAVVAIGILSMLPVPDILIPPWRRIDPPSEIAQLLYGKTSLPITLYSLNPQTSTDQKLEKLYDFPILGKLQFSATQTPGVLQGPVYYIKSKDQLVSSSLFCKFSPRHAVSCDINGKHYDILICYRCGEIQYRVDGKRNFDRWYFWGKPDKLNALFAEAGIPMDDPSPK